MTAPLANAGRFIGQRLPRREDARLLTGRGTFIDDVVLPGMLHAAFVRSPIARGRIVSIDLAAALQAPGVRAIYTGEDLQRAGLNLTSGQPIPMPPPRPLPPLALGRVTYVGDPVAIVVAEDRYLAEDAAALVSVAYEAEPPVLSFDDARRGAAVHPETPDNVAAKMENPGPADLADVLASAPHVVTGVIRHQRVAHSAMEARGVVASPNGPDELTVHIPSQGPQKLGRFLSDILGRPEMSLRVVSKDVGGSFGLKSRPWREETAVIGAALLLGRPIKWAEDRFENLTTANQAREQECAVRIAFDADGRLLAAHAECALNNGAYPHFPDANAAAMMFMWAAYKQPRYGFRSQGFHTNTVGLAAYRGPWAMESLARETLLDIAARQMGRDPIELRRTNLVTAADLPHTTNLGMVLEDVTPAECLDELLRHVDVAAFRAEQAAARLEGCYLGLGVAAYVEPTAMSAFPPYATEVAQVRIAPTGRITATLGTHSQGQGTQTTMAQVIAEALGARFEEVVVVEDDSAAAGYGAGSGGSRQAVAGGGAAMRAAELLQDKIKRLAAHLLNASPEAVRVEDGQVHVEGAPEMTRSLRQIAEVAYGEPARLPPGMEPGLEAQYRYPSPPITFSSAAHACVVEVDVETGFVKILRWVASEDCGVVINPGIVEGQIAGGLAQAIGTVLLEEMVFDGEGNPKAATFKDYPLPLIQDLPDIEFAHIVTPAKGIGGFRGVGEGGAIIGPPTLINAIHDALAPFGVTCLDLPLTPSKLVRLIDAARAPR
jgi:carbon-monoxide dehydrogenase large subunit